MRSPRLLKYQAGLDNFPAYLRFLREMAVGIGLRPGWVAMSYFWMIEDHVRLVGVPRLRPKLAPALEIQGGHIGYDVPPSARRKGYGSRVLAPACSRRADARC